MLTVNKINGMFYLEILIDHLRMWPIIHELVNLGQVLAK